MHFPLLKQGSFSQLNPRLNDMASLSSQLAALYDMASLEPACSGIPAPPSKLWNYRWADTFGICVGLGIKL